MKFRVHIYQVQRVPYEVEAESQKQAAELVHADGGEKLDPCGEPENIGEWQPDSVVDLLLPNGDVDYENSRTIDLRSALDMRKEALELLEKAQGIDGLKPMIVVHEYEAGSSGYIGWSNKANSSELTEEMAASILDSEYEPDNEALTIEDSITLEEMTGVSESSWMFDKQTELADAYKIAASKNNCEMADVSAGKKYEGKIIGMTDHFVVQSIGKNAVIHHKWNLSEPVEGITNVLEIAYKNGIGQVSVREQAVEGNQR